MRSLSRIAGFGILELGELAEKCGRLVDVDAHVFAFILGDAHPHGRTKASHGAEFEKSVDDDGVADQVEPAIDRIARQPLSRALVQLVEDRKLVIARDLFEACLYACLVAGCGHVCQTLSIDLLE